MRLPEPRGALTQTLFDTLARDADTGKPIVADLPADVLSDADVQLALWSLYELHYRSFDGVDERWEWNPTLLTLRAQLEDAFESALHTAVTAELDRQSEQLRSCVENGGDSTAPDFGARFFELVAGFEGPQLAQYVHTTATAAQVRDLLAHRSIYQLKESDPHTWAIPRLAGAAKSALVELQFDEYGCGVVGHIHSELFATTLSEAGLDPSYGAYINEVGAATLVTSNTMSFLTLHRRNVPASMGHLAAFESSSSLPCKRYAAGLRRLGFSAAAAHYFEEHVEADAVHEQLAVRAICANIAADDPRLEADVFFGALCCLVVESREANEIMARWESGDGVLIGEEPVSELDEAGVR